MTREQIISRLQEYLGVELHDTDRPNQVEIRGTTGVCIARLDLGNDDNGWYFGGYAGFSSQTWKHLCRINEG